MSLWVTVKDYSDKITQGNETARTQSSDESFVFSLRTSYNLALQLSSRSSSASDHSFHDAMIKYETIVIDCRHFLSTKVGQVDRDPIATQVKEFLFLGCSNLSRAYMRCFRYRDALQVSIEAAIMAQYSPSLEPLDVSLISRISVLIGKVGDLWTSRQLQSLSTKDGYINATMLSNASSIFCCTSDSISNYRSVRLPVGGSGFGQPVDITRIILSDVCNAFELMAQMIGTEPLVAFDLVPAPSEQMDMGGIYENNKAEGITSPDAACDLQDVIIVSSRDTRDVIVSGEECNTRSIEPSDDNDLEKCQEENNHRDSAIEGVTVGEEQASTSSSSSSKSLRRNKYRGNAVVCEANVGLSNLGSLKETLLSQEACSSFGIISKHMSLFTGGSDQSLANDDYSYDDSDGSTAALSAIVELLLTLSNSNNPIHHHCASPVQPLKIDEPSAFIDQNYEEELETLRRLSNAEADQDSFGLRLHQVFLAVTASFVTRFTEAQITNDNAFGKEAIVEGKNSVAINGVDFSRTAFAVMQSWSYIISAAGLDAVGGRGGGISAILDRMENREVLLLAECAFELLTADAPGKYDRNRVDEQLCKSELEQQHDALQMRSIAQVTLIRSCSLLLAQHSSTATYRTDTANNMCGDEPPSSSYAACSRAAAEQELCTLRLEWLLLSIVATTTFSADIFRSVADLLAIVNTEDNSKNKSSSVDPAHAATTAVGLHEKLTKRLDSAVGDRTIILIHRSVSWQFLSKSSVRSLQTKVVCGPRTIELEKSYENTRNWLVAASGFTQPMDSFVGTLLVYFSQQPCGSFEDSIVGKVLRLASSLGCWEMWVSHATNVMRLVLRLVDNSPRLGNHDILRDIFEVLIRTVSVDIIMAKDAPSVAAGSASTVSCSAVDNRGEDRYLSRLIGRLLLFSYQRRDEFLLRQTCQLLEKVHEATARTKGRDADDCFQPAGAALCLIRCFIDSAHQVSTSECSTSGNGLPHCMQFMSCLSASLRSIVLNHTQVAAVHLEELCASVVFLSTKLCEHGSSTCPDREITSAIIAVSFARFFALSAERKVVEPDVLLALHQISLEEGLYQYSNYQLGTFVAQQMNRLFVKRRQGDDSASSSTKQSLTIRQTKEILIVLGNIYFVIYRLPMAPAPLAQDGEELALPMPLEASSSLEELHDYILTCESHFGKDKIRSCLTYLYECCPLLSAPKKTEAYQAIRDIMCSGQQYTVGGLDHYARNLETLSHRMVDSGSNGSVMNAFPGDAARGGDDSSNVTHVPLGGAALSSIYYNTLRLGCSNVLAASSFGSSAKASGESSSSASIEHEEQQQHRSKFHTEKRILKEIQLCLFDLMQSPSRFYSWSRLHGCLAEWFQLLSDEIAENMIPELLPSNVHYVYGSDQASSLLDNGRFSGDLQIFQDTDEWTQLFGNPLTAYRIFEVAGLRRGHGLSDNQKANIAMSLCKLIALKNAVATILDNLVDCVFWIYEESCRQLPGGSRFVSQNDNDSSAPEFEEAVNIEAEAIAKVAEAHGVFSYIRGHEFAKGSDHRRMAFQRSRDSFRKAADLIADNSFALFMSGKLTMILDGDLNSSLSQLSIALSSLKANQSQKAHRIAIQYTIYSIISKACIRLLDPSISAREDVGTALSVMESYSFQTEPVGVNEDRVRSTDDADDDGDRLFQCLSDALGAILDCRRQDQYHSSSVYRVSKILTSLSRLTSEGSGLKIAIPESFLNDLSRWGLSPDNCGAWTESEKLFDKKRPQIVALWCVETASDGYDLILQRTCKFDGLRRKFIDNHLQLAILNDKFDSVMELANWTLANRKDINSNATSDWMGTIVTLAGLRILEYRLANSTGMADNDILRSCYALYQLARRRILASHVNDLETFLCRVYAHTVKTEIVDENDEIDLSQILLRCAQLWPTGKILGSNKRNRVSDEGGSNKNTKKSQKVDGCNDEGSNGTAIAQYQSAAGDNQKSITTSDGAIISVP